MSCEEQGCVVAEEWVGDIMYLRCFSCDIIEKYDCTLLSESE